MSNLAVQCYGGHGYIREYGVEQYVRDARIAQIYEGTNGVQAMDLIGRKLTYKYGRYLRAFTHPVQQFIEENKKNPAMAEFTKPLHVHLGYFQQASLYMAKSGLMNPNDAGAGAVEYLRLTALVVFGWIWAVQAKIALDKLAKGEGDKKFYTDKVATARFYMQRILPQTISLLAGMTAGSKSLMEADVSAA